MTLTSGLGPRQYPLPHRAARQAARSGYSDRPAAFGRVRVWARVAALCTLLAGSNAATADANVAAGDLHTCSGLRNGPLKCWGNNVFGQLGQGDQLARGGWPDSMGDSLLTIELGTGRNAVRVAVGSFHACALLDNGDVKCWGESSRGKLGQGSVLNPGSQGGDMGDALPRVDLGTDPATTLPWAANRIALGASHSCALLANGRVKCWGSNLGGELGLGDNRDRGGSAAEMGDALPFVNLGTDSYGQPAMVSELAAFGRQTCAQFTNGKIKCWGANDRGQLGLGDTVPRGLASADMGNALPFVNLGPSRRATKLAGGSAHVCALLDNGGVKCWGRNDYGQLGQGDAQDRGVQMGQMGSNLRPVDLGAGAVAVDVAAGSFFSCALLGSGELKCWGRNEHGQLGQGDNATRGLLAADLGANLLPIALGSGRTATAVAAGLGHVCAWLDNLDLKCWGFNADGQLGVEDVRDRGPVAGDMGDALPGIDLGTR